MKPQISCIFGRKKLKRLLVGKPFPTLRDDSRRNIESSVAFYFKQIKLIAVATSKL